MNCHVHFNNIILEQLSNKMADLLTDEKLSQQQGRIVPFGKEPWRIQLPQEQNSKEQAMTPVPLVHEQDTSDEINSKFGIIIILS